MRPNIIKMINNKNKKITCFILFFAFLQANIFCQKTFPTNDVQENFYPIYAFTNATIYVSPDNKIEKGTLIIKKNKIIAVGTEIIIPDNAIIKNLNP